jgi:hypothetical protein
MRSPGEPETRPESEQAMKRQLDAADVAEDTVWELMNSRFDYPQACSVASGVLGDEIAYQPNPPRAAVLVGRDAFVKML